MAHFIDRRLNGKNKSAVNRQRFMRRYKQQIKKAVTDAVNQRSIQDLDSGESISIPSRDITEPFFHQGEGGDRTRVLPGNDQFSPGDRIERPQGGGSGGSGEGDASNSGEGTDSFQFEISKDEYLDILFDDLELPNLQENSTDRMIDFKTIRAGFTNDGVPSNINIVRSLQNSLLRRTAMSAGKKRQLHELEEQIAKLRESPKENEAEILILEKEADELRERIRKVPFIDTFDLKFNAYVKQPIPNSQAVMFCLMDVSGSMDQATKDMAKRFYLLLYLFLTRNYERIEIVFIRHHTQAKEVDEQEFFYSQETGGTIVSSALKLMKQIIAERYPEDQWNIYAAQASDGDNWADDSPVCRTLLDRDILPFIRNFFYIEITARAHQTLWREYESLAQQHLNFDLQHIRKPEDIFPVFREFFRKEVA